MFKQVCTPPFEQLFRLPAAKAGQYGLFAVDAGQNFTSEQEASDALPKKRHRNKRESKKLRKSASPLKKERK